MEVEPPLYIFLFFLLISRAYTVWYVTGNIGVTAYCNLLAARVVQYINEICDSGRNMEIICFYDLADFFFYQVVWVSFVSGVISSQETLHNQYCIQSESVTYNIFFVKESLSRKGFFVWAHRRLYAQGLPSIHILPPLQAFE